MCIILISALIRCVKNRTRPNTSDDVTADTTMQAQPEPESFSGINLHTPEGRNMLAVSYCGLIAALVGRARDVHS